MRKIFLLLIMISVCYVLYGQEVKSDINNVLTDISRESISVEEDSVLIRELMVLDKSITIDHIEVVSKSLDSLLNQTIGEQEIFKDANYYLSLACSQGELYVEIMPVFSFDDIIDLEKNKNSTDPYLREGVRLYGMLSFGEASIAVVLQPSLCPIGEDVLNSFFKIEGQIAITRSIRDVSELILYLDKSWCYKYNQGRFYLLNPLMDK